LATVSDDPTVVVANLGQQNEELLPIEQLHDQVHGAVPPVDNQFVNPNDVVLRQSGDVFKLSLEVEHHFVVSGLDDLDGELPVGRKLATSLDQSDGALPQWL